jgi:hypothetical protein
MKKGINNRMSMFGVMLALTLVGLCSCPPVNAIIGNDQIGEISTRELNGEGSIGLFKPDESWWSNSDYQWNRQGTDTNGDGAVDQVVITDPEGNIIAVITDEDFDGIADHEYSDPDADGFNEVKWVDTDDDGYFDTVYTRAPTHPPGPWEYSYNIHIPCRNITDYLITYENTMSSNR